jgi:hypothetical protein
MTRLGAVTEDAAGDSASTRDRSLIEGAVDGPLDAGWTAGLLRSQTNRPPLIVTTKTAAAIAKTSLARRAFGVRGIDPASSCPGSPPPVPPPSKAICSRQRIARSDSPMRSYAVANSTTASRSRLRSSRASARAFSKSSTARMGSPARRKLRPWRRCTSASGFKSDYLSAFARLIALAAGVYSNRFSSKDRLASSTALSRACCLA